MIFASIVALTILGLLAVLQAALIAGAPLGHYAWGGKYRVLPLKLRIGSATSILIYVIFAAFVLSKSELWILIHNKAIVDTGLWVVTGYLALGIFLNAISRSKPERTLMTPVAAVLTAAFLVVTLS